MLDSWTIDAPQVLPFASNLVPQYDDKGQIACVVQEASTRQVLRFDWMDRRSFERTLETGIAHYSTQHRRGSWRRYVRPQGRFPVQDMLLNDDENCLLILVTIPSRSSSQNTELSCFRHVDEYQD